MTTGSRVAAPVGARLALALPIIAALALAPTTAAAQSPCGASHTVDTGDTFAEIAQRCGITIPALLAANPGIVDESDFEEGDRLRIPDPGARQPSPVAACGPSYTVRPGDTLIEIATKCGLTIPLLVTANPPFPRPLGVHAGMTIRIPHVSSAAARDPGTIAAPSATAIAAAAETAATRADTASTDAARERAAADSATIPAQDLVRVEGVLEAGPRCMRVRDAAGTVHGIHGEVGRAFQAGDGVVLLGVPADEHDCPESSVLELRILYRGGR